MTDWIDVPEPVTWTIRRPIAQGSLTYDKVTLRAPTGEDVLKATAMPGASNNEVVQRLIAAVSAEQVPFEVVKQLPDWQIAQMAAYFEEFAGIPAPDPLERWRAERKAASAAALAPKDGDGTAGP